MGDAALVRDSLWCKFDFAKTAGIIWKPILSNFDSASS